MNLADKLIKLGGYELLEKFSKSFLYNDKILLEVETDRGEKLLLELSRVRKILAGAPPWYNPTKGYITEKEAAKSFLNWKVVRLPRIGGMRAIE